MEGCCVLIEIEGSSPEEMQEMIARCINTLHGMINHCKETLSDED